MKKSITVNKYVQSAAKAVVVGIFWLAVWFLLASRVGKEVLLPSPFSAFSRLWALMRTSDFWYFCARSLLRVVSGFLLAVLSGVLFGIATYKIHFLHSLFYPLLTVVKSTPVASFIILALVWMNRGNVPLFIAFLMVLPIVWENIYTGLGRTDRMLMEVAKTYRFRPLKKLKLLYFPAVLPYFTAGCKTSLGLAWKAGIAAEVLCTPNHSIGKMLYESKLYLETTDLFAWTLAVILFSMLIEQCFMRLITLAGRYRNDPVLKRQ